MNDKLDIFFIVPDVHYAILFHKADEWYHDDKEYTFDGKIWLGIDVKKDIYRFMFKRNVFVENSVTCLHWDFYTGFDQSIVAPFLYRVMKELKETKPFVASLVIIGDNRIEKLGDGVNEFFDWIEGRANSYKGILDHIDGIKSPEFRRFSQSDKFGHVNASTDPKPTEEKEKTEETHCLGCILAKSICEEPLGGTRQLPIIKGCSANLYEFFKSSEDDSVPKTSKFELLGKIISDLQKQGSVTCEEMGPIFRIERPIMKPSFIEESDSSELCKEAQQVFTAFIKEHLPHTFASRFKTDSDDESGFMDEDDPVDVFKCQVLPYLQNHKKLETLLTVLDNLDEESKKDDIIRAIIAMKEQF